MKAINNIRGVPYWGLGLPHQPMKCTVEAGGEWGIYAVGFGLVIRDLICKKAPKKCTVGSFNWDGTNPTTWGSSLGKPSFKKNRNFMKNFHKMVTPPPYCICEILIQIFYRKFRDKIKMRQNSVNNHQSHPKFRCSTRLMLWTSYLSLSYTSKHPILAQNMPFWAFKFLNKSMKTSRPPPPVCEKLS